MAAGIRTVVALSVVLTVPWLATSAHGTPRAPSDENWAQQPTGADFEAVSKKFGIAGLAGRTVMRCFVADDGTLNGCRTVLESPVGSGFGPALLSLAPSYRRKPPGKDDLRVVNVDAHEFPSDTAADWVRKPRAEDILGVWPTAAMKRGLSGEALISCVVTVQGALVDCVAVEERPADAGFGNAAIALTPQMSFKPARLKGVAVPSPVRIPIRFKTDGPIDSFASKKVAPVNLPWVEAPSYADVVAAYPKKAAAEKLGGRSTLACDMTKEGRLTNCDVLGSEPRGFGFDLAAKRLARQFRLQMSSPEDREAARTLAVHLPVTFDPVMLTQTAPVIGKPSWASLPSGEEARAAFQELKQPGTVRAMLACTVQPGGGLGDCKVDSETPVGSGAGAAGLTLVPRFKVSTWTTEGLPTVGGVIRVPVRYDGNPSPTPK